MNTVFPVVQTASGAALAVKPQGMSNTAYIMLAVLLAVLAILGGGWKIWLKLRPQMEMIADQREARDTTALNDRVTLLEQRLDAMAEKAHSAEMKLVSALAAYRLVVGELQKQNPDNPVIKQAQELLNVSYPSPRGVSTPSDAIRRMPESDL